MQLDAATGSRQPLLHQLGVMIVRIVEKDMDEHHQRIKCFDRFEQRDRRGGIDGLNVDHPGLPALEIDRAVNIDALAPARLFDRKLVLRGRPEPTGRAAWVGWTASANSTTSSLPKEFRVLS